MFHLPALLQYIARISHQMAHKLNFQTLFIIIICMNTSPSQTPTIASTTTTYLMVTPYYTPAPTPDYYWNPSPSPTIDYRYRNPTPAPYFWNDFPSSYDDDDYTNTNNNNNNNNNDDMYFNNNNSPGFNPAVIIFPIIFIGLGIAILTNERTRQGNRTNPQTSPQPQASSTAGNSTSITERPTRPARGATTTTSNNTGTNTIHNGDWSVRILNILLPEQQCIQKEQMVYDPEDQSYRFQAIAAGKKKDTTTTTKSDDDDTITTATTSCALCLEYFAEGDILMMGLCQHVYHHNCCLEWIKKQNSCPLCRKEMFDKSTYKMLEETIQR